MAAARRVHDRRAHRARALVAALLAAAIGLAPAAPASAADAPAPAFSAAEVQALSSSGRVVVLDRAGEHHVLDVADAEEAEAIAAQVRRDPQLVAVEIDPPVYATGDPLASRQWEHSRIGLEAAHEVTTGDEIVVAVLDTGVDASHEDLAGQVLPGYDAIARTSGGHVDVNGHGTLTAGMLAAVTGNGIGIAGAAPDVRILPVRVLDASGKGSMSDVAAGVAWAVAQGADVINLSLAGPYPNEPVPDHPSPVRLALQSAVEAGVVVVASAGNSAELPGPDGVVNPVLYPGAYPETVAVAATDSRDVIASFSSYHDHVDVAAPGVAVTSTVPGDRYESWSGTSAAAPLISATTALALEASGLQEPSTERVELIVDAITSTALDLGAPGHDPYYGHGRVRADRAVLAARQLADDDPASDDDTIHDDNDGGDDEREDTPTQEPTRDEPIPVAACPGSVPSGQFRDTRGSVHESYIDCMAWWQITTGTDPGRFSPQQDVTRAQIATFLHRTLRQADLLPAAPPRVSFRDVPAGHTHATGIETLAGLGVIHGTDARHFSPGRDATRAQMASLIVRMHEEVVGREVRPAARGFPDVAGSPHETNVRKLVTLGVTTGYPDGTFQPGGSVTRGQMATFVMRYVEHLAEEGLTAPPVP